MSIPRFYAPDLSHHPVELTAPEARHAVQSRRLRSGDRVVAFDGQGREAHGVLDLPRDDTPASRRPRKKPPRALIHIEQLIQHPRPTNTLRLIVAGCKGTRLEWLVEKCCELGVTQIDLADFDHSVVHSTRRHTQRLGSTVREACKQSGRTWFPTINTGLTLFQTLDDQANGVVLVAHPDSHAQPLTAVMQHIIGSTQRITAIVGPEGGLSSDEVDELTTRGARFVSLAQNILRVETAALACAATWSAALSPEPPTT